MSPPLSIAELEVEFGAVRDRFGELVVARSRGDDVRARAVAYGRARRALASRLAPASRLAADGAAVPVLAADEPAAFHAITSTLAWMDELEPVEGLAAAGVEPAEDPTIASLRRATTEAFGEAAATIRVGAEDMDRVTAFGRLATEPDPAARRAIFEALRTVWAAIDGDGGPASPYRTLLRSSAARWARDGSPVEAAAAALGMAPGSFEPTLRSMLARWRETIGPEPVEPWDYRFTVGALERRLRTMIPAGRLRAINDAHLAGLGADPAALGIHYDLEPRPGRPLIPVAFTISEDVARQGADGSWRAATPWVFATYAEGGSGNLEELLHESGHALHYAAIRTRPAFFEPPVEAGGFVEGVADLLGWDVHEPEFQERHLGSKAGRRECRLARYGGVMLDVCWALLEIELHRDPDRSPNDVWADLTEAGLGIVPHPGWAWWAARGQLVESPGYMANYALSAIVAAAIRARIRELRGAWWSGDPGWYAFVAERLLRFGAERSPADVLAAFLGAPLSADALLADLAGARRATLSPRCRRSS